MTIDALQIYPQDNVCVATHALKAGTTIQCADVTIDIHEDLLLGSKLALSNLKKGDKIIKFGEPIGSLTADAPVGTYIHTHNMQSDYIPTPLRGELVGDGHAEQEEKAL